MFGLDQSSLRRFDGNTPSAQLNAEIPEVAIWEIADSSRRDTPIPSLGCPMNATPHAGLFAAIMRIEGILDALHGCP